MSVEEPAAPADLAASLGAVGELLVVLDFDGTLAPIVEHPDDAALAPGARDAVARLCELTTVTVLTGRAVDDVHPRLDELPVAVIGGHGTEVLTTDGTRTALFDREQVATTLRTVEATLRELCSEEQGWLVEPKPTSIAVHHRRVATPTAERVLPMVRSLLEQHAAEPPGWRVLDGHMVTELRPEGVDKGTALAWFADRHPDLRPFVVGDDVTDEDAFEVAVARGGHAVLVATEPRETAAGARLPGPTEVVALLELLGA